MAQINKSNEYFNTVLYTGNGGTKSVTGVGFQPDLCWIKSRSNPGTYGHEFYDSIRGVRNVLQSSTNAGEFTIPSTSFESFDSDGFTVQLSDNYGRGLNENNQLHVGWNWLAGGTASSNTDGDITSSVSANTDSGFSVVTYTGTGSNATVGHGLGVVPKMVIVKSRSNAGTDWIVGNTNIGWTKLLRLNTTDGADTNNYFNNTAPTTDVFSLGTTVNVNGNGYTYVAYCFAEKKGFSKFGSYVGNGSSDGTFVYTGFKPAFLMVKSTGSGQGWNMFDNKRDPFNLVNEFLIANSSNAEATGGALNCNFLSNGFKLKGSDGGSNSSGATYIYMCFAESPIVGTNGVPATAR